MVVPALVAREYDVVMTVGGVDSNLLTYEVLADVAGLVGDGTDDIGILIDDSIYNLDASTLPADNAGTAVLVGGPGGSGGAVVVKEQLKFGDAVTGGDLDSVVAAIEAKGILVGTQIK